MDELNDPQLETMLGRLSGAYPDANVAYVAVRGKVRQAKRRRAVVVGTAACALLLGVGVVAAQTGGGASNLSPQDGLFITVVSSHVDDTEVEATEASTESSTESTEVDTTAVETTAVETTLVDAGSGSEPVSNQGHGNNNSTTSTSTATTKPSTKPTVPAGEQTTSSKGGSLTYSHDADTLTLIAVTPADGFHEDKGARIVEAGRLRVEFTDGSTTWRIEVRLEGGKAPIETSQHG